MYIHVYLYMVMYTCTCMYTNRILLPVLYILQISDGSSRDSNGTAVGGKDGGGLSPTSYSAVVAATQYFNSSPGLYLLDP